MAELFRLWWCNAIFSGMYSHLHNMASHSFKREILLYGPFCHGVLKLDPVCFVCNMFSLNSFLQFILQVYVKHMKMARPKFPTWVGHSSSVVTVTPLTMDAGWESKQQQHWFFIILLLICCSVINKNLLQSITKVWWKWNKIIKVVLTVS